MNEKSDARATLEFAVFKACTNSYREFPELINIPDDLGVIRKFADIIIDTLYDDHLRHAVKKYYDELQEATDEKS